MHLKGLTRALSLRLHECAPQQLAVKDSIGWGSQDYSVQKGYEFQLSQVTLPPKPGIWRHVWHTDGLPKVNILCQTLAHGKILTGENLRLTFLWIVSSPGLFRNLFYKGLATEFVGRPPWYTFLVAGNPLAWDPFTTSLFLNEFNQALFMEVKSLPRTMATKVVTLISEHFNTKCLNISIPRDLDCQETIQFQQFPLQVVTSAQTRHRASWQLHLSHIEFIEWQQSQSSHTLYFDGASKHNLRVARAGGVLFGPRGNMENTYSQNLDQATNNQAKAYALLQGLTLARAPNIYEIVILGDSKNAIRYLQLGTLPRDAHLCSIFHRNFNTAAHKNKQNFEKKKLNPKIAQNSRQRAYTNRKEQQTSNKTKNPKY